MTKNQREIINDNIKAFNANFCELRLEKENCGSGWYVYYPADSETYIQYCYNIHYLNGWIYGVVQGFLRGEFKKGAAENE